MADPTKAAGLGMRLGQGLGMRLGQGFGMRLGNEAGSRPQVGVYTCVHKIGHVSIYS